MRKGKISLIGIIFAIFVASMLILIFVPVKTVIVDPKCETDGYTVKSSVFGVKYISDTKKAFGHQYKDGFCVNCGTENELIIIDVKIIFEDKAVSELNVNANTQLQMNLIINSDSKISANLYSVSWSFKNFNSELSVSSSGLISVGNVEGKATLIAIVSAKNTITVELPIIIESSNDNIKGLTIYFNDGNTFIEGQIIEKSNINVWKETDNGNIQILDYTYDASPLRVGDSIFSVSYRGFTVDAEIIVLPKQLQYIEIVKAPLITEYYIGQYFIATGMIVVAHYEYLEEEILPSIDLRPLTLEDSAVLLSYTYGNVTKTVSQPIVVLPKQAITVENVEILIDDIAVTEYTAILPANKFLVKVRINNGKEIDYERESYSVFWSFSEEAYGSTVSDIGEVTLGDFLGETILSVTVVGSNRISASLHINVIYSEDIALTSLTAMLKDASVKYIEGQHFSKESVLVWGWYGEARVRILNFEYEDVPLTSETTEVLLSFENEVAIVPITVIGKTLQSIEIITPPDLLEFYDGQIFDPKGMVVKANFEYISEEVEFVYDKSPLHNGDSEVVISFTYQGITKSAIQPITVIPKKLLSIAIDDVNVRKYYTQYDIFNPQGLVVKATYDYFGEVEVLDFEYSKEPLLVSDRKMDIIVQEGSVTKTAEIDITVFEPYERIIQLRVLMPTDISISWVYSFNTASGKQETNNLDYFAHNLTYDKVNGIYDIPLGANVTAFIRNPAVNAIVINGSEQSVNYSEKSYSWKIIDTNDLSVGSVEMAGRYYVVRFMGDNKDQGFLYDNSWNGRLSSNDLSRLATVFYDNENFYYSYLYNGETIRFYDLRDRFFNSNVVVTVVKNTITSSPITVRLHSNEDIVYVIQLSENEVDSWDISSSIVVPAGYLYDGLAAMRDGVRLSVAEIQSMLSTEHSLDLYIRLIPENINYNDKYIVQLGSSSAIVDATETTDSNKVALVGLWDVELKFEGQSLKYSILLNGDGTYEYLGYLDDVLHCNYKGNYRLSGNRIVLISIETDMDIMVLNSSDFSIVADNYGIKANVVFVLNGTIEYFAVEFNKLENN